jgi:3',5'-cyclic AMP phosphodiesterase CpdA
MSETTPLFTMLHVSDVHATESGQLYGSIDPIARLEQLGEYVAEQGINPEVVVITGDLIQRGNAGAYPAVEQACRRLERALNAPVITVLGNHDDPHAAKQLTGHTTRHFGTHTVGDYRIVRLDSHTRELGPEQLEWLCRTLARPYGLGTILAIHHAPIGSPMPVLSKQGLADAAELMRAVDGSDVRAILAGHFHHSLNASLEGIPTFVAPALAYHQVMHAGPDQVAGHDAFWCSLVQLSESNVVSTPIELRPGAPVFTQQVTGS